jgi:hypothetical protein
VTACRRDTRNLLTPKNGAAIFRLTAAAIRDRLKVSA